MDILIIDCPNKRIWPELKLDSVLKITDNTDEPLELGEQNGRRKYYSNDTKR